MAKPIIEMNETGLGLLKLCQINEQYIQFLDQALGKVSGIAMIHGFTWDEKDIQLGKNLRAIISDLKTAIDYPAIKEIVTN